MNAKRILISALLLLAAGLTFNQWLLQKQMQQLRLNAIRPNHPQGDPFERPDDAMAKLRQAEVRLDEARQQLQLAEQRLNAATAQIAAQTPPPRLIEGFGIGRRALTRPGATPVDVLGGEQADPSPTNQIAKRSWGPEQAAGEPDTFQDGDISTAWASLQPNAGVEWLKLEYERAVDITEVRVRETYNPGGISKVTAFLANGTEVTLWEGVEPKAEAPVEMAFTVASPVNAKSVKIYLDTRRVSGWNEIDAVQIIGRDGSQQWARQATASSTFADLSRSRLVELEDRLTR